ncbi:MAG TPA: universal stress protein [Deferrisomatales bacterium]|nr:universal stress protein [Deferrisomatales bacterium]
MKNSLLHVFRNTPRGAETFRQALYFSGRTGLGLRVHFPEGRAFVLCVGDEAIHVDLDESYRFDPSSARDRAEAIGLEMGVEWQEQAATGQTASTLPDLQGDWALFSLPRSMNSPQPHPWIPSAVLGPRVRAVIGRAALPILLPAACLIPWEQIWVPCGGTEYGERTLRWGARLARDAGVPLRVVTWEAGRPLEQALERLRSDPTLAIPKDAWVQEQSVALRDLLQDIPRTALVGFGAFGDGRVRQKNFGSQAELVLQTLPHNLLMVGPRCRAPLTDFNR